MSSVIGNTHLIKKLMADGDWTQEALANECDFSPKTIYNVLDKKSVNLNTLTKIAEALNVPVSTVISDKPDKTDKQFFDLSSICLDWRLLRDKHKADMELLKEGDHWVLLCRSPEAFDPIRQVMEDATIRGVQVSLIRNDVEPMAETKLGQDYFDAMAFPHGWEHVIKNTTTYQSGLEILDEKIQSETENRRELMLASTTLPIPFLGMVCIRKQEAQSWAIIAPYTPYLREKKEHSDIVRDWAMHLPFENPLFSRYKNSFGSIACRALLDKAKKEKAEKIVQRALDVCHLTLGPDHPLATELDQHIRDSFH